MKKLGFPLFVEANNNERKLPQLYKTASFLNEYKSTYVHPSTHLRMLCSPIETDGIRIKPIWKLKYF
jgi:hypothetical protein